VIVILDEATSETYYEQLAEQKTTCSMTRAFPPGDRSP